MAAVPVGMTSVARQPLGSATMQWIVGVVAVIVVLATYLTWIAGRIDRLHARTTASADALDAALVRRAAAAIKLGDQLNQQEIRQLGQAAIDSPDGGSGDRRERTHQGRPRSAVRAGRAGAGGDHRGQPPGVTRPAYSQRPGTRRPRTAPSPARAGDGRQSQAPGTDLLRHRGSAAVGAGRRAAQRAPVMTLTAIARTAVS